MQAGNVSFGQVIAVSGPPKKIQNIGKKLGGCSDVMALKHLASGCSTPIDPSHRYRIHEKDGAQKGAVDQLANGLLG